MTHALRAATALAVVLLVSAAPLRAQSPAQRAGAPGAAGQRRFALVIGNNSYRTAPLANAVTDAVSIASALRELKFEVTGLTNLPLADMERAVDEFAGKLTSTDIAVFFYAGHGVEVENENYLVPVDFTGSDVADLKAKSYSATRLHNKLEKAAVRIVILDACRDNPFRATRGGSRGLAGMDAHGSLIAFATSPGSTAADVGVNGRNGLFTEQLLTELKRPGLTANELFRNVRLRVYEASQGKQLPWVSDGLLGDFVFTPGAPGDARPVVVVPVQPQPGTRDLIAQGPGAVPFRVEAGSETELSRQLATRLSQALRGEPPSRTGGTVRVTLEMSTRPAPFVGTSAITADYVATLERPDGAETFTGNVLGFSELTVRNDVLQKVAQEMAASLARRP